MHIRDNVRRRRRERIVQLLGERPAGEGGAGNGQSVMPGIPGTPGTPGPSTVSEMPRTPDNSEPTGQSVSTKASIQQGHIGALFPSVPDRPGRLHETEPDPDPEKWWKEQQKTRDRAGPSWRGAGGLTPASVPPTPPASRISYASRMAAGFAFRLAAAAALFGAAWIWFHSDLPGSAEARSWTVDAVSKDMDFQAVEVWYEQTFGGSPSFLPMFRSKGETQAVFGGWKRSEAVLPTEGRMVQTFAQDGSGIRIAASGGSAVKAVYAGRVLQVASEDDGKATVLVQHAGRIVTIYGNVENPSVQPNDWVEAGGRLGTIPSPLDNGGESLLYFAVKQNGKTVDPAEVVPFD